MGQDPASKPLFVPRPTEPLEGGVFTGQGPEATAPEDPSGETSFSGGTISTQLLNTHGCRDLSDQLNAFENAVFGVDFACDAAVAQAWMDSGCLFYAAVCGEAVMGRRFIFALASVFITSSRSRDRLLAGEIADHELTPWCAEPSSTQPTIYLSSVVSDAPHHVTTMYDSLQRDVVLFRDKHGIEFHSGFAIATGPAGQRHMSRSGFRMIQGCQYRGKYDFMAVDSVTAVTPLWQGVLRAETMFLRRLGQPRDRRPDGKDW